MKKEKITPKEKKEVRKLKVLAVGKKLSNIKAGVTGSCGTVGCSCGQCGNNSTMNKDYFAWLDTDFDPTG